MKYSTDTACTGSHKADHINSRVLEWASDIAEKLTEKDCEISHITCYNYEMEGDTKVQSYTEEAQDIFNEHYDEQVDSLYKFANEVIKIDAPTPEEVASDRLSHYICDDEDRYATMEEAYNLLLQQAEKDGGVQADEIVMVWQGVQDQGYTVNQLLDLI